MFNLQFVKHPPVKIQNQSFVMNNRFISPPPKNAEPTLLPIEDPSKKPKWGSATWFLFHTLAEKLKEDAPPNVLSNLFKIIILICNNLPCPTCTKHATDYMKKINPNSIRTKSDLKALLFIFHNEVNKRKNYAIFEGGQLEDKYSSANTKNIIYHFFEHYKNKDFNINMITNNMHREQTAKTVKYWLIQNIQYFEL
jgi:hypothetical protein